MNPVLATPARRERLAGLHFNYAAVGATQDRSPAGYRSFNATRILSPGTDLNEAADRLFGWHVHTGAGLRVAASALRVTGGETVELRIGFLAAAPCRVVYTIEEALRRGFAYGTLEGHPESGEELFLLQRANDGRVGFTIRGFSRPATLVARWAGPAGVLAQQLVTRRYLAAI